MEVEDKKIEIEVNGIKNTYGIDWFTEEIYFDNFDTNLIICRPFLPNNISDKLNCNFYFVSPNYIDLVSIKEICKVYKNVFMERCIADRIYKTNKDIKDTVVIIDDCITTQNSNSEIRVAFLASSDTHVEFMLKLAEKIPNHIFLIPSRKCKDDAAAAALDNAGKKYIEIDYKATECAELIEFQPYYIYSATDWTSEFIAVKRIISNTDIKTIALQEGPEDWHLRFYQNGLLKVLNHYRNADIFFSQGSRSMFFIRPKYFAIPGNPKINGIESEPLPAKPKVLINCNFTYLNTKPSYESKRAMWMESVLRVCKEIGIDYIISKHPRDDSEWDDPNLIKSNAFSIRQQIIDCSISISRFSSIPYETLAQSRKSIYYNNHLEPMPTFMEDKFSEVMIITEEEELKKVLLKHMSNYPYVMNAEAQENYLTRYAGRQDGYALDRVISGLNEIAENRWNADSIDWFYKEQMELYPTTKIKNIVFFVMPSLNAMAEYTALVIAEASVACKNRVLFLSTEYSEHYGKFYKLKYHKDVEYVLTNDFSENLDKTEVDYLFFVGNKEENKLFYANAQKLASEKKAKFVDLDDNLFAKLPLNNISHKDITNIAEYLAEYSTKLHEMKINENDFLNISINLNNFFELDNRKE